MRLDELTYGQTSAMWVEPASGLTFPSAMEKAKEVRVWQDESTHTTIVSQGDSVCEIVGKTSADMQRLTDLCSVNLTRITWIADLKVSDARSQCLIQSHTFAGIPCPVPCLELAVDEKVVTQAQKLNRHARGIESTIEWLDDQCFLPCARADGGVRAFVSTGVHDDEPISDAFLLHGKSLRVFVRKVRTEGGSSPDGAGERMIVDKITRDRRGAGEAPIRVLSGGITFCDHTVAGQLRGIAQAQLMSLVEADDSFLRVWGKYGEAEEEWVLRGIRAVGVMRYDSCELISKNRVRFDLCAPIHEALTSNDELEAAETAPPIIEDPDMTWADCSAQGASSAGGHVFGRVDETNLEGSKSLVLQVDRKCEGQHPPLEGCLFVPVQGHLARFRRRQKAQDRIRAGICPMPQLGLLLEGESVPVARPTHYPALTPGVRERFLPYGPTPPTGGGHTRGPEHPGYCIHPGAARHGQDDRHQSPRRADQRDCGFLPQCGREGADHRLPTHRRRECDGRTPHQ